MELSTPAPAVRVALKTDIVVIGAGQAGLSSAYHLKRRGLAPNKGFIVGGGISAVQLLDEISRVTTTTWVTRRPPEFCAGPFTEDDGRRAVALVEDRVRRGLPPLSVVSVTGLPITPAIEAMRERGVLERLPRTGGAVTHPAPAAH